MNAYQHFLDFFSMHNKARLDGLDQSYFTAMTPDERADAFRYLESLVSAGGDSESVRGLFLADENRAFPLVSKLLGSGTLGDEGRLAAATELYRAAPDPNLLKVFVQLMSHERPMLRAMAAYFAPSAPATMELINALKGMIRTETDELALIHATNKLLACYDISDETVGREKAKDFRVRLNSGDIQTQEAALLDLDRMYGMDPQSG